MIDFWVEAFEKEKITAVVMCDQSAAFDVCDHQILKSKMKLVVNISGYLLLVTGILILTNQLQILGFYLIEYFPILQNIG